MEPKNKSTLLPTGEKVICEIWVVSNYEYGSKFNI